MLVVDYESEASGSFFIIERHIDMLDLAKMIKGTYYGFTGYVEVNIVNEELRIGIWVLFTLVRWLLFRHIVVYISDFNKFRLLLFLFCYVLLLLSRVDCIAFLLYGFIRCTLRRNLRVS